MSGELLLWKIHSDIRGGLTTTPLATRNDGDFNQSAARQAGDLHHRARRQVAAKILFVGGVHAAQIIDISEVNGRLHHVGHGQPMAVENRADFFHHRVRLLFDRAVAIQRIGLRLEGDLAREEQKVAVARGLCVIAARGQSARLARCR